MSSKILQGCGTALVTPFRNGKIDYDAYAALVRRQVKAGIHFLVPLGTTAETPTLDDDEKSRILEITRREAPGVPLLVGAGTNSLHHTIHNMRVLDDADMFLVVVPYYNKPTPRGQYEYFKAVAAETDKPIVLYNVPGRTGANMSSKVTITLSEIPNIIGIKEASGNLEQVRNIITNTPHDFCVLSGNDDQTVEMMLEGGDGVISVASNVAPALMVKMVEAAASNDYKTASVIFRRLIPLFDACFVESNPIPVKCAMALMELMNDEFRLPLCPAENSTRQLMAKVIEKLGNDIE